MGLYSYKNQKYISAHARNVWSYGSVNNEFSNNSIQYRKRIKPTNLSQSCWSYLPITALLTATLIQNKC